jgi:hypothetical protein
MWALLLFLAASQVDYADGANRDAWLRHPVLGDASFDSFTHAASNPIHRGSEPYKWPVNGFLFKDPKSGNWYCYVGHYAEGYKIVPGLRSMCTVFRSADQGKTWQELGPIFKDEPFSFKNESATADSAPDVCVIYADNRYHMVYDWSSANTTWENAANPPATANSGVGYAWSDTPEGPFIREQRPVATTRDQSPLIGKYRRLYASSIVRRQNDWLVLILTDSGPNFGWALLTTTAANPEGPYAPTQLLLHPEMDRFHPPLLEFFPAFTYDGKVYAPATSVAMNRNYQCVFTAPIEQATDPAAWALAQAGSVWHAEPVENEDHGIWGQTFSGFIDNGTFNVMFPSRDREGNGTINIASRPWAKPYGDRGFVLSGHRGPSIALLKRGGQMETIEAELDYTGTVTLLWDYAAPLGPDAPRSDSTLHPLMFTRHAGLQLNQDKWRLYKVGANGAAEDIASGACGTGKRAIRLAFSGDSYIEIDGVRAYTGPLPNGSGGIGLLADKHSWARVTRFNVTGGSTPVRYFWLHTEGLLCAAQNMANWQEQKDNPLFRFGMGAVSKSPDAAAKFNVDCSRFRIHAPKMPKMGSCEVMLDGKSVGTVDFSANEPVASAPVFDSGPIKAAQHAIMLKARGLIPLDCLETEM